MNLDETSPAFLKIGETHTRVRAHYVEERIQTVETISGVECFSMSRYALTLARQAMRGSIPSIVNGCTLKIGEVHVYLPPMKHTQMRVSQCSLRGESEAYEVRSYEWNC